MPGRHAALTGAVLSAGVIAPLVGQVAAAPEAKAVDLNTWTRLADCETGDRNKPGDQSRWSANTGNGFYGGLQFQQSTWVAAGGTKFAPRADLATKEQQIQVAEAWFTRVVKEQGVARAWASQWPFCSQFLGIRNVAPGGLTLGAPPVTVPAEPRTSPSSPADTKNCDDFSSREEVQAFFNSPEGGGRENDWHGLDGPRGSATAGIAGEPCDVQFPPARVGATPEPGPAPEPSTPVATPTALVGADKVIAEARRLDSIGTPYRFGGNTPATGIDCSRFTQLAFAAGGVNLPRTSREQATRGISLGTDLSKALPGDLLIFDSDRDGDINHTAIYLGDNRMIHNPNTRVDVEERRADNYPGLVTIRRVLTPAAQGAPSPTPAPTTPAPVPDVPEPTQGVPDPTTGELVRHVVRPGDWMSRLALHYGECGPDADIRRCWHGAAERNKDVAPDPNRLLPGMVLEFLTAPPQEEVDGPLHRESQEQRAEDVAEAEGSVTVQEGTREIVDEYTVKRGDVLGKIAERFGTTVRDLYDRNRDRLSDPNRLTPGMVLRITTSGPAAAPPPPVTDRRAVEFSNPLRSMTVTSAFGLRTLDGVTRPHRGVDLRAPVGTQAYAVADCEVVLVGPADGFGTAPGGWVVCKTTINGVRYDLVYGHMNSVAGIRVGQKFSAGDPIVKTGSNGNSGPGSVDPHLHFEVWEGGRVGGKAVSPIPFLGRLGL